MGRERVDKNSALLQNPNSPMDSPMGTLTLKKNERPRESVASGGSLDTTNTMEMSIRQVVEVKKMTSLPRKK